MIHKTVDLKDKRFNLLFSSPRSFLFRQNFNWPGARLKSKNRTIDGWRKYHQRTFIVWQIIRLSSLVIDSLLHGTNSALCQESYLHILVSILYLSFSLALSERKSRIIQINFSLPQKAEEHKDPRRGSLISVAWRRDRYGFQLKCFLMALCQLERNSFAKPSWD